MAVALPQATTIHVSISYTGGFSNASSGGPAISADGRLVAFDSYANNLVSGDTDPFSDAFVRDLGSGTTIHASPGPGGVQGNGNSAIPSISADGRYVAFQSTATNLVHVDTNALQDIFVHDLQTGTTQRVSVDSNGTQANQDSFNAKISRDGRYVAFESTATNLVAGDTSAFSDVFAHDAWTGSTIRVSVDSSGAQGNGRSTKPDISGDGRYVVFESTATNLVPADMNLQTDVFIHDLLTGQTARVSVDSNGVEGNGVSLRPAISADGSRRPDHARFVALLPNLLPRRDLHLLPQSDGRKRQHIERTHRGVGTVIGFACRRHEYGARPSLSTLTAAAQVSRRAA